MYAAPPPIAITAIIPIMIPTTFPLFDFFVVERSFSTCSINFSSIVGSFEASSSFCGSDFLISSVDLIYGFSVVLSSDFVFSDVALTSVILNEDSVVFLILGKLVFCLSDGFILLVICLCLGVRYCSTSASTYFLSCIEIMLLF